jgi:hypothetical protein
MYKEAIKNLKIGLIALYHTRAMLAAIGYKLKNELLISKDNPASKTIYVITLDRLLNNESE